VTIDGRQVVSNADSVVKSHLAVDDLLVVVADSAEEMVGDRLCMRQHVVLAEPVVSFLLDQPGKDRFSAAPVLINRAATPQDRADSAATGRNDPASKINRCMMRPVQNVVRIARYHLNQWLVRMYFVAIVLKRAVVKEPAKYWSKLKC